MKRSDLLAIAFLCSITLIVFSPVFYSNYIYTDEGVQLWLYRKGSGFQMFAGQGRGITEKLFQWLFGNIGTVRELSWLRAFSLLGWISCIPLWYFVIHSVVRREGLSPRLSFLSVVYLIATPPFAICAGWGSVMELFIANTAGLLAGYFCYRGLFEGPGKRQLFLAFGGCLLFSMISLFTYQNGFGCFLLPFVIQLAAKRKLNRKLIIASGVYLAMYIIYFMLFRVYLLLAGAAASERTGLHFNLPNKIIFLLTRPLNSAFHFSFLYNEKSIAGFVVYACLLLTWILLVLFQQRRTLVGNPVYLLLSFFCLFGLTYLPSLVVKENYASNRTLLAIEMAVFMAVVISLLDLLKRDKIQRRLVGIASLIFIANAWYHFNRQFLFPVKEEYRMVTDFIGSHYKATTDTVYFIRPGEDFFVHKYSVTRSWDEFGVPSTFFEWTPEFFVKQWVKEKTGDRAKAEKLVVKNWLGREAFKQANLFPAANAMVVDVEKIMDQPGH